jgi:hypothetical protein
MVSAAAPRAHVGTRSSRRLVLLFGLMVALGGDCEESLVQDYTDEPESVTLPFDFMTHPRTSLRDNMVVIMGELLRRQGRTRGVVVEIGVAQGRNSDVALKSAASSIAAIHLIDPFMTPELAAHLPRWERDYNETSINFYEELSLAAVERFEPQSLDWIYIDGDHSYDSVKKDIQAW